MEWGFHVQSPDLPKVSQHRMYQSNQVIGFLSLFHQTSTKPKYQTTCT